MTNNRIKVLLVDDHTVVRTGLRYVLQSFETIEPVGEASTIETALLQCEAHQPEVVLMDLKLNSTVEGIAATALIRQKFPHIRVIILTSFCEKTLIEQAIHAGAVGYLLKGCDIEELIQAIHQARVDKPILAAEATLALLQPSAPSPVEPPISLTNRQREILKLLVNGLTNQAIAETLTITLPTARHHVSILLAKLGATNRAEAIRLAIKSGLVKP